MSGPRQHPSEATSRAVERSAGELSTLASQRMEEHLGWYRDLSAEERSQVGLVAQAGISQFIAWFHQEESHPPSAISIFANAPQELTRVGEPAPDPRPRAHRRRRRRVARREPRGSRRRAAAARVRAALLARDRLRRRGGLCRRGRGPRRVGRPPRGSRRRRRAARRGGRLDAVAGQRARLGRRRRRDLRRGQHARRGRAARSRPSTTSAGPSASTASRRWRSSNGRASSRSSAARATRSRSSRPSPTASGRARSSLGPTVPHLFAAGRSARAALSGLAAAAAWPDAAARRSSPTSLLPERALAGDPPARRILVDRIHRPLAARESRPPAADGDGLPRERRLARGDRARALRAPQHGALPARAHLRRDGLRPHVTARGLDRAHRPGPGSPRRDPRPLDASSVDVATLHGHRQAPALRPARPPRCSWRKPPKYPPRLRDIR